MICVCLEVSMAKIRDRENWTFALKGARKILQTEVGQEVSSKMHEADSEITGTVRRMLSKQKIENQLLVILVVGEDQDFFFCFQREDPPGYFVFDETDHPELRDYAPWSNRQPPIPSEEWNLWYKPISKIIEIPFECCLYAEPIKREWLQARDYLSAASPHIAAKVIELALSAESSVVSDEAEPLSAHRQILEYVYHIFRSEGHWVSSRNLVHDLYTLGDTYEIAKDIGSDLIRVEDPDRKEDALAKLTLKGVSLCKDSNRDLSDFVSVLQLFARTYLETRDGQPRVTEDDFIKELDLSKLQARKMTLLVLEEGGLYSSASYGGAEPPRFDLGRSILKFRDVNSIEGYFTIRDRDRAQRLAASSGDQVTQEPSLYDVFISYSHKDEELAKELRQLLEARDLKCFMSSMDIRSGDPWAEAIRDALVDAQELLLVITPDSIKSRWVMCEGGAGWALGKRMVPALLEVEPDLLPEPIKRHQAKKIDTATQRESLAKEIAERLRK
jgi:hypothetical protein